MPPLPKPWRVRFATKYKVGAPDECWEWTGHVGNRGYGQLRMDADVHREPSNRAAYLFHKGPIPEGLHVLHSCDNKLCVNPAHLHLGSCADNAREAAERGLLVNGTDWEDVHTEALPRGEDHKRHKLTEAQIRRIRTSGESGVALANEFFVAPITISRIRRRLAWKHVT